MSLFLYLPLKAISKSWQFHPVGKINLKESKASDNSEISYVLEFVKKEEIEKFSYLNKELFRLTAFTLPLKKILKRNKGIYEKNYLTSAFICLIDENKTSIIGFSHVLPLNDIGKREYLANNGLNDGQVSSRNIAGENEWTDTIVLFSLGKSKQPTRTGFPLLVRTFEAHLMKIIEHLDMLKKEPKYNTYRIYVQVDPEEPALGRLLVRYGFEELEINSGNGFHFWELIVNSTNLPDLNKKFLI